jgi:DNA-binding IclR family transcriptional regulator
LAESEERGYAMDDEENIIGLRCVAAPVVLDNESVLGAVSVSGPSRQMTKEKIETTLKDSVMRAANVVQINTKFS